MQAQSIIVPAKAVRDLVVERLGVPESLVTVCYPFIDVSSHQPDRSAQEAARRELRIPEDALVVGMCGAMIARKGIDCFLQVAAKVIEMTNLGVYFVWVGGAHNNEFARYMLADLERLGLSERVRLVPERTDTRPYLEMFDVFFLSSRSDPFPLVCLEAAVQARAPIVCFADAGGMPELVGDECGIVVPYLRIDAAAQAICTLLDDPALRKRLGANADEKVRTHHDVSRVAPQIAEIMSRLIAV